MWSEWISYAAILVALASFTVTIIVNTRATPRDVADSPTIAVDVLSDARSFFSVAMGEIVRELPAQSPVNKVARLLQRIPELGAFPVIDDRMLARQEAELGHGDVAWILSRDTSIEFAYGAGSGDFASVVAENLRKNVTYNYLIPRSSESESRSAALNEDYPLLRVRLFEGTLIEANFALSDEFVIYERRRGASAGYMLFSDAYPRRWIMMDPRTLEQRLADARNMWDLSQTGSD